MNRTTISELSDEQKAEIKRLALQFKDDDIGSMFAAQLIVIPILLFSCIAILAAIHMVLQ